MTKPPRPASDQDPVDQPVETAWSAFMARHMFDDIVADTLAREESPPQEDPIPPNG